MIVPILALFSCFAGGSVSLLILDILSNDYETAVLVKRLITSMVSNLAFIFLMRSVWLRLKASREIKLLSPEMHSVKLVAAGVPVNERIKFVLFAACWGIGLVGAAILRIIYPNLK